LIGNKDVQLRLPMFFNSSIEPSPNSVASEKHVQEIKQNWNLPLFFSQSKEPDFNNMTVDFFLLNYRSMNLGTYLDNAKITSFLEEKAKSFEKEILDEVFCPRCKKPIPKSPSEKDPSEYYYCPRCKKKVKAKGFINSRFTYGTCAEVIASFAQNKSAKEIFEFLVTTKTNHNVDYGKQREIPDEKTNYDTLNKSARKFYKFHRAMLLLKGGIPCITLMCDDAFARKRRKRRKRAKNACVLPVSECCSSNTVNMTFHQHAPATKKRTKEKKQKRFYYAIVTLDADLRFIICLHMATSRDKSAFLVAFSETLELSEGLPNVVRGDLLRAMVEAARALLPEELVIHDFRKLKPWEKKDLNKIERRIRDFRKTVGKRRRSGSLRVLSNLGALVVIQLDYLRPMIKALKGRSPAQAAGIPYPFYPYDWRKFMIWVDWVFDNFPQILKSGLKKLPGCCIKPSSDASDQVFKERLKSKSLAQRTMTAQRERSRKEASQEKR
jgi:hypothetical protein